MNSLTNWSIGLLTSTKNQKYIDIFKKTITDLNFDFVCYTEDDYPDTGTDIHNNCISNQTNFDIAFLLIDERYGTIDESIEDRHISFTKAEYEEAAKSKVTLSFIKSSVYKNYKNYINKKRKGFINTDDNKKAIFDFIEEIEGKKLGEGVLLHSFNDENDLENLIKGQIKGLSKQVARRYILEKNIEQVENYKRPGQIFSVKNIVGNKTDKIQSSGYYIEPNAADPKKTSIASISEFIKNQMEGDENGNVKNLIVHGNAGVGKSTSLMRAFLVHKEEYSESFNKHEPQNRMPVFFSLTNVKIEKDFNPFNAILQTLNKKPFPVKDFWNFEDYVFYFDSFDESIYAESAKNTEQALKVLGKFKHVLTTRTNNYYYIQRNFPNFNSYSNIAKINGWKQDKIVEYINAKYEGDNPENIEDIKSIFSSIEEAFPPLIVTLCLYNVDLSRGEDGSFDLRDIIKKDPNGRYMQGHILKEAVLNNLRFETLKETQDEKQIKKLVDRKFEILNEAGWIISSFLYKHEVVSPDNLINSLCYEVFKNRFKNLNTEEKKNFITKTLKLYFDLENSVAVRAVHSLFVDLFGACCYLQKVKNRNLINDDAKVLLTSQGNRMVGDFALSIPTEEKRLYIDYLTRNYKKSKSLDERVIYCYTIPRLLNDQNLNDKPLKKPLTMFCLSSYLKCVLFHRTSEQVMLLNWMVQLGSGIFEKIYYRKLNKKNFAEANRIAYMIYMQQSGSKIDLKEKDLKQNPKRDWIDTLYGVLEHYKTNDKRHRLIRRIDIKILRTYINVGYSTYPDLKFIYFEDKNYTLEEFFKMLKENDYIWTLNIKGEIGEKYLNKIKKHALLKDKKVEKARRMLLKELDFIISDLKRLNEK